MATDLEDLEDVQAFNSLCKAVLKPCILSLVTV